MALYQNQVDEIVGYGEVIVAEHGLFVTDTVGFQDTAASDIGAFLTDVLGVSSTIDSQLIGYSSLSDGVGFDDALGVVIDILVSDTIGIQDTPVVTISQYVQIIDTMVVTGIVESRLSGHNLLTSILGLDDDAAYYLEASILDQMGLNDTAVNQLKVIATLADTIGINAAASTVIGIVMELTDTVDFSDYTATNAILKEKLEDGAIFSVTAIGPTGDSYTGWVMNSENFAVSTYNNYNFSSLAKINGSYYGVQEDGVYLLEGTTDSGQYIDAVIRSAKMEFGTSNLKSVTQAYIGFRGDSEPVLKIVTDEAYETWYLNSDDRTDLHTERLRLAKGTIGRYWQFELVMDTSTIMELDSVELFPIVLKRKV